MKLLEKLRRFPLEGHFDVETTVICIYVNILSPYLVALDPSSLYPSWQLNLHLCLGSASLPAAQCDSGETRSLVEPPRSSRESCMNERNEGTDNFKTEEKYSQGLCMMPKLDPTK